MAEPKTFEEIDEFVLHEWKDNRGRVSTKLRIVRWVVDGKSSNLLLEKRSFFLDKKKERLGFRKNDIEMIFNMKDEILDIFAQDEQKKSEQL